MPYFIVLKAYLVNHVNIDIIITIIFVSLHFFLAHCLSVFKRVENKTDIDQQDFKIVDLHFIESE